MLLETAVIHTRKKLKQHSEKLLSFADCLKKEFYENTNEKKYHYSHSSNSMFIILIYLGILYATTATLYWL